jgi:hypothetical protein
MSCLEFVGFASSPVFVILSGITDPFLNSLSAILDREFLGFS